LLKATFTLLNATNILFNATNILLNATNILLNATFYCEVALVVVNYYQIVGGGL
jgi:hypothetical protein